MIEIVFSDSACGCLKMAQRFGTGKYHSGSISVIISHSDGSKPTKEEIKAARQEAEEKMRLSWEKTIPIGGNSVDVYGFNLALSVGDISESQPGVKREQVLGRLYSIYPNDEGRQAALEICQRVHENVEAVKERVVSGEPIRIWYSNQPDEMCGLYWFMDQLNRWKVQGEQVSIVKLPEWEDDENGNTITKGSWGELAPEEWHRYLDLQRSVSPSFMQYCAYHWQKLKAENAPLRAVLNGELVNAVEYLYDDFILCEITAESNEFQEAMIVGRVLGKYRLGIGDAWVAFRIEEMVLTGKLEVVSAADDDMPAYHRVLRKC